MEPIIVYRGRTCQVSVSLGRDVSNDVFTSQIREEKHSDSQLIAEWNVTFLTDGVDGELVLTLDDAISNDIEEARGWMDIKQVTGTEPISAFDEPLEVLFKDSITV